MEFVVRFTVNVSTSYTLAISLNEYPALLISSTDIWFTCCGLCIFLLVALLRESLGVRILFAHLVFCS